MPKHRLHASTRWIAAVLLAAMTATASGCHWLDDGRPRAPNAATQTADTMSYGGYGQAPDCYSEPVRTADGAYPGPGPHGTIDGFVGTGVDSECRWRERSAAAVDVTIEVYAPGPDGELNTDDDTFVASTIPAISGCYRLEGIETPGTYLVRVAEPAVAVCDSDVLEFDEAGVARVSLDPIGPVVTADFGVTR